MRFLRALGAGITSATGEGRNCGSSSSSSSSARTTSRTSLNRCEAVTSKSSSSSDMLGDQLAGGAERPHKTSREVLLRHPAPTAKMKSLIFDAGGASRAPVVERVEGVGEIYSRQRDAHNTHREWWNNSAKGSAPPGAHPAFNFLTKRKVRQKNPKTPKNVQIKGLANRIARTSKPKCTCFLSSEQKTQKK